MPKAIIQLKLEKDNLQYCKSIYDIDYDSVAPKYYEPFEVEYIVYSEDCLDLTSECASNLQIYSREGILIDSFLLHEINIIMTL